MKRCAAVTSVFLLLLSTDIVCAEVLIRPNDANINYYGRFDFSRSADSVAFDWPGAIIEAVFPGPSIGVELKDNGSYFDVEIDGVKRDSLPPSAVTHRTISTTLSTADHTIRITLRTNGYRCSFRGFYLADGKVLAAKPAQPVRKMEFIGDSWTAGDVVLQPAGGSTAYLWSFEATLTYARLTSKAFHAQDKLIARGGCGMVTSNGGAATMPTRYPRILCDGSGTSNNWDFASWIPDIVTIFLGINDFNNNVTDANFRTAYTAFINTVRGHYTNVPIILIGLPDNVNGHNILTNVQTVAQSFSRVYTFSSPLRFSQAAALWNHPTPAQDKLIADSLISLVKTIMGWDTTAPTGIITPPAKPAAGNVMGAGNSTFRTALDKIVFPSELSGSEKEIVVFSYAGRPLRRLVTGRQALSLGRDFGLPAGMYILKTTVLR